MRTLILSLALIPSVLVSSVETKCYKPPEVVIDKTQAHCLAVMIYGEARGESKQGQIAVAYTALNRAVKKTVCKVVLAPYQYSIFNNNPALRAAALSPKLAPKQKNIIDKDSWNRAVRIARVVLKKEVGDPTNGATHYLAPTLMKSKKYKFPKWSKQFTHTATIDNHRFYKPVDITVASL